jgi:ferritin-like metal-binding protein YciE
MTTPQDTLISWLNDAYAMEKSLIQVLENHANDAKDHPDMRSKILEHIEATKRHADAVRQCIERLGGSVSSAKAAMGTASGFFHGLSTEATPDELVKNVLADFASENFEIAAYKALIEAARIAGRDELIPTFEQIIRDERDMASWLDRNLGKTVESYMGQPVGA